MKGAAVKRKEVVELVHLCVAIARCLIKGAEIKSMPPSIKLALEEIKDEVEEVARFAQTYGTQRRCCPRLCLHSHYLDTAANHKQNLESFLDAIVARFEVENYRVVTDVPDSIQSNVPNRPGRLANVPSWAPLLPKTYVKRNSLAERVILDLNNPEHSEPHFLLGMGGGGKTLLASYVVREERVRSIFEDGIFWVRSRPEGKEYLRKLMTGSAYELASAHTNSPHQCPREFSGTEEVARHMSEVRERNGLRCLIILDDVWDIEVVNAFFDTGFRLLVTTRQRTVISPKFGMPPTEVGNMAMDEALEVLGKASQAVGPLPEAEAKQVACDCGMNPLALSMAGTLVKDQPLLSTSWQRVHIELQNVYTKLRGKKVPHELTYIFSVLDLNYSNLPEAQRLQLHFMAIMAKGIPATSEMLASLWDTDVTNVPTGTRVLVDHCLLQEVGVDFCLHDLVLDFLELTIKMDIASVEDAILRQSQYLARLGVLYKYSSKSICGGLYSLIALWNAVKKYDKGLQVEVHYMENLEGVTDQDHWNRAGQLLSVMDIFSGAETMLRKALDITIGKEGESQAVAEGLSWLTSVLQKQGNFEEARPLYERCLAIWEKVLGPEHPDVARSLNSLASLLKHQGNFEEARPLYERSLAIWEKVLGPEHPDVASSLNNLASLLKDQGNFEEARPLYERSRAIWEKVLGPEQPDVA
ncbi:unnamed protein product [Choristocarpus tenellus]